MKKPYWISSQGSRSTAWLTSGSGASSPGHRHGQYCWNSGADYFHSCSPPVFLWVHPRSPMSDLDHPYPPGPKGLTGRPGTTKLARIRCTNDIERCALCSFLRQECCFYVNQSCIVKHKIWQLQTDLQKSKKQLSASGQWIIDSPIWNRILPFSTLLHFIFQLSVPFLLNFFSRFLQQQI